MDDLSKDPIIDFYIKMSKSTEHETELPIFNEIMLRCAFKEILGKTRTIKPFELDLYRKLLLFHYSDRYKSVPDLLAIMTCFDEAGLNDCIEQFNQIMLEWLDFRSKNLQGFLYKQAFMQLITEWTRRHLLLYETVDHDKLHDAGSEIIRILDWNTKNLRHCLKNFEGQLANRVWEEKKMDSEKRDAQYLVVTKIYEDIKNDLNPFIVDEVSARLTGDESPVKKKRKVEDIEALDIEILNGSTEAEEEDSKQSLVGGTSEETESETVESFSVFEDSHSEGDTKDWPHRREEAKPREERTEQPDLCPSDSIVSLYEESESGRESSSETEAEDEAAETESPDQSSGIVNCETAIKYISALQAYAITHGHVEAIGLLDNVDSIFRKKK